MFKSGRDVISPHSIPHEFDLVLSGHIHTAQNMKSDQNGRKLAVPILYAGSTERTSFAERLEDKGSFIIGVDMSERKPRVKPVFKKHPTRPMYKIELFVDNISSIEEFDKVILSQLSCLVNESVVQIKISGTPGQTIHPILTDSYLRKLAPDTMNISFSRHSRIYH